jgi:hypothetical protein
MTAPTETTSLIPKNGILPVEPSLNESIPSRTHGNGAGTSPSTGTTDEENGAAAQPENPLFEGQPEVVQKMYLLFPAVALGVSVCWWQVRGAWVLMMRIGVS